MRLASFLSLSNPSLSPGRPSNRSVEAWRNGNPSLSRRQDQPQNLVYNPLQIMEIRIDNPVR